MIRPCSPNALFYAFGLLSFLDNPRYSDMEMNKYEVLATAPSEDYELLDSGSGYKLERFGKIIVSRPDPQVLWDKKFGSDWQKSQASFEKNWVGRKNIPDDWKIRFGDLSFSLKLSSFKHVGVFPEQEENWKWIKKKITDSNRNISVLNLFGYTGGATLAALSSGAEVCHVDGSKVSLNWAKTNVQLSGFSDKPVRFILDDALSFVKREVRRGNKYDAIIMDPPAYGHGPNGELWKIEDNLSELLSNCYDVLSENPLFILMSGYSSGYSAIGYENCLKDCTIRFGGSVHSGELSIRESRTDRSLPAGIFARWTIS